MNELKPKLFDCLKDYSGKQNKYWDNTTKQYILKPNELYTSNNGNIDTGFLCAKIIKHAFKTYPKVRIGKAELETQQTDEVQNSIDDFYNIEGSQQQAPAMPQDPNPPFGNQTDTSAGVTVNTEEQPAEDDGAF